MHWTTAKDWTPDQRQLFFKDWTDAQLFEWLKKSKVKLRAVRGRVRKAFYINLNHKVRAEIGARIAERIQAHHL